MSQYTGKMSFEAVGELLRLFLAKSGKLKSKEIKVETLEVDQEAKTLTFSGEVN